MTDYTPTEKDIRSGFSLNYARDYETLSKEYYDACRFGEEAFSRWLEDHDRQVAEKAWDAGWDESERFGYPVDPEQASENPYRKAKS